MERDDPVPTSFPAPAPSIHVTPENVVELAAMFRDCADLLELELIHLDSDLELKEPWMADPISGWALAYFNLYFFLGDHTFAKNLRAEYDQHRAMCAALLTTAQQYGLTEELIAAGFTALATEQ